MMNNTFFIATSAQAEKNAQIPRAKWHLSSQGRLQAETFAKDAQLKVIDLIYVSEFDRAYQTAVPIARKRKVGIERSGSFNEIGMAGCPLLGRAEYDSLVEFALKNQQVCKEGDRKICNEDCGT
jgi:broad specificity phosphatase PhoE